MTNQGPAERLTDGDIDRIRFGKISLSLQSETVLVDRGSKLAVFINVCEFFRWPDCKRQGEVDSSALVVCILHLFSASAKTLTARYCRIGPVVFPEEYYYNLYFSIKIQD
ncbi:hypothetical protein V6N13_138928 [Hibiscus sabdariffa]|uniref:Uncharacterized protein n=1 Tax=Hibiscus sabdariffa TaxID=183260 RepID=A0ABR2PKC7_9ROSI